MKLGWIRLLVETIVEQWVWVTQLLLPVPLLNPHPEGAPNAKPTRALKGGVGSHVSGGGALKHNQLWPTFHRGDTHSSKRRI